MTDTADRHWRWTLGTVLCRIVVPLWILTGAFFKLKDGSPRLLPKNILLGADALDLNLNVLLATIIGLEILAVAVLVLVVRFSRAMAIFMLSAFCLILVGEMIAGSSSCGCLGKTSLAPWQMLVIDGVLLLGVLVSRGPRPAAGAAAPAWPVPAALLLTLAGFVASFALILPWRDQPAPTPTPDPGGTGVVQNGDGDGDPAPVDPTVNPQVRPQPKEGYWFATQETFDAWIGKPWKEIDLFQYMARWPTRMDDPVRYVAFYGRTCEHCEEMFRKDLAPDPELARQTVGIEVPVDKRNLRGAGAWAMPDHESEILELPLGTDWIMTTPLTLRIENGIVQCAEEGDHHGCMGLEGAHEH